jgi:YesN/AraC family two-component response regulator
VPMTILGIVNYYKTLKIVQNNIEKDSMGVLNQAVHILDSRTKEINKLSDELSADSRVKNFLYTKASDSREEVTMALEVINGLMAYTILNDSINEVYIYSKNNDTIISSRSLYSPDNFYSRIFKDNEMSYYQWLKFIQDKNFRSFKQGSFTQNGNIVSDKVVYTNSIPSVSENYGSVMIFMDKEKYSNIFSDVVNEERGFYYVLDENNKVIVSNDKDNKYSSFININNEKNSGVEHIKSKTENAMMLYKYSTYNKWKYVTFIPHEVFVTEIKSVKESSIIIIGISIVIAFFMSLLAASNNYKKIRDIVNLIKGTFGTTSYKGDDFNFITNVLKHSYSEIKTNEELLKKQIPLIRQSFLSHVLRESKNIDINYLKESIDLLQIDLNFTESTVLVFRLMNDLDKVSENKEYELYKFAFRSTIEKYAEDYNIGYTLEIDNDNIALICGSINGSVSNLKEEINNFLLSIKAQIDGKFTVAIGVGNIYSGYKNLNNSYGEANEATDYAIFNNKSIIFYENINKNGKIFSFPVQKEVQLINYIKNCKKEQALEIVNSLYKDNYNNKEITYDMMKMFVYDLYCTVIKVLGEFKIDSNSVIFEKVNVLDDQKLRIADTSYILTSIEVIISVLCDFLEEQKKDSSSELKYKIIDFVDKNFLDNQISLDIVADKFNVTPQYMSKFFKEHIGINYVEYVNSKRIEKAKEYLLNNETVREAASKAGFENMGNFIKVFKKLVGVTPSEYKQNALKDKAILIR